MTEGWKEKVRARQISHVSETNARAARQSKQSGTRKGLAFFLHISGISTFNSSGASLWIPSNILYNLESVILTWKLKVSPFLRRATEAVPVLLEIAAAGHEQLITALLGVTLRVKLDGEVDSTRNVNFILRNKHRTVGNLGTENFLC